MNGLNEAFLHPLHLSALPIPSQEYLACEKFFKRMDLPAPYIPESVKAHFTYSEGEVFGTKKPEFSLYDIDDFVRDSTTKPCKDFILTGRDGHGIASQAIHYYAKKGPLLVFLQVRYNNAGDQNRVDGLLLGAEKLYKAVEGKNLAPNKQLLVVHSDFKQANGWGWIEGVIQQIDETTWHKAGDSCLIEALKELKSTK